MQSIMLRDQNMPSIISVQIRENSRIEAMFRTIASLETYNKKD